MWLSMMRKDHWIVLVEEALQHNACNLSTWGIGKTSVVLAGRHNDFCLAWSAVSSFSLHNWLAVTDRPDIPDGHNKPTPRPKQLAFDTSKNVLGLNSKANWKLHPSKHTADLCFTASYLSGWYMPDLRDGLTYIYLTLGESTYLMCISLPNPQGGHTINK